jgi:penicillin-insensitive murein endopeptidase
VRIDFEAMAEHLYQLSHTARNRGLGIEKVIFDPRLAVFLFKTKRASELQASLPFMKKKPWVRHDEHYHVDFSLPCRPLGAYPKPGS